MAYLHNLEPLLHELLQKDHLTLDPALCNLADRWERAYFETLASNLARLDLFEELSTQSRMAGVEFLVLKGLSVAASVYQDPALRPMADLDILCHEEDLEELAQLARGLGFRHGRLTSVNHLRLLHGELNVPLEIHFDLYDVLQNRRAFLDRVWEGRRELELDGRRFPAPSGETELTILLAHLVQHDFRLNLRCYLDLAGALVRADSPELTFKIPLVRAELADVGLSPEFAMTLELIRDLFDVPLPEAWFEIPENPESTRELITTVRAHLLSISHKGFSEPLLEARARPGIRLQVGYLARLLFPPPARVRATDDTGRQNILLLYLRHLWITGRRGWRKLRSTGITRMARMTRTTPSVASTGFSAKRCALQRRRSEMLMTSAPAVGRHRAAGPPRHGRS